MGGVGESVMLSLLVAKAEGYSILQLGAIRNFTVNISVESRLRGHLSGVATPHCAAPGRPSVFCDSLGETDALHQLLEPRIVS